MADNGTGLHLARTPIAIIGLSGMFPMATDVREFWDNIVAGRDCLEEVPPAWWSLDDYYDPDPFATDKTYGRRGGFLTPVTFDPLEFGMPPKTLDSTGLVQLLGLTVARDVLRDAALGRTDWYDSARTGVVLGVCGTNTTLIPLAARMLAPVMVRAMLGQGMPEAEARRAVRDLVQTLPPWTEDSFPGILANVVSGRVANRLDLRAANHTVDAACASSLAALRAAVDELTTHRADLMITGGCDADNSILSFMFFSKTPALSFGNRVRPFDAEADGTLIGEGVGMVALKRLADAERDGDRVYAVLRGLGSSSDGIGKSIYAPCGDGQLTALRRAYADAECPPRSVALVEAHGTGTPAGDEVELTALNRLMGGPGESRHVAVGSVKSQIGHTKAAAGVAGLIKAALALHHKILPPTINVDCPSAPAAQDGAVYINTTARPWIRDPGRPVRRAGVSSFGFGGVNYHAVLEEHPSPDERALHRIPRACLWHAPDPAALLSRLESGAAPDEGPVPADHARVGFVAADEAQHAALLAAAAAALRDGGEEESRHLPSGVYYRRRGLPSGTKVGALFTGQGNQYVNMGLRALLAVPPLRAAFDTANALFPPGDTLARAVFPPPVPKDGEPDHEPLDRTAYAQPAIGALAAGQYRFLRELGFAPDGLLGHSFGELTALWAAGVFDDEAFTALARARGQAMETRPQGGSDAGAMAAVRAPEQRLAELLTGHPELTVCNRNAPDEQVVGGPTPAVERFVEECAAHAVPAKRLPVAAAFHTPLVEHAVEPFAAACADVAFAAPVVPVYADTAGAAYGAGPDADRRTLVEQLRRPVDFAARLAEMYADGIRVFVEFGPKNTLSSLVERVLGPQGVEAVPCDRGGRADSAAVLKEAALRLRVLGLPLTGVNRYDAPPRPEHRTPSSVARLLEGPNFALRSREAAIAHQLAGRPVAAWLTTGQLPQPAPDPLSQAAAEHLATHVRYLDGQLETARELTGLLRSRAADGQVDEALAAAVTAISDHSLAVGEAHIRAGEVVTELLRGADDARTAPVPPPLVAAIPAPADEPVDGAAPAAPALVEPEVSDRSALAELFADGASRSEGPVMSIADLDVEEAEQDCRRIVAEKTGYDIALIEADMYIQEDLGIDSLKQVEIAAEVWRRYPVIKREELFRFSEARTVGDLSTMLREVLTGPRTALQHSGGVPFAQAHVTLRPLPAVDVRTDAYPDRPCALMPDDGGDLCAALGRALTDAGWLVHRLMLPGVPGDGPAARPLDDWTEGALVDRLSEPEARRVDLCVVPVSRSHTTGADEMVTRLTHATLLAKRVCPALTETARSGSRAAFVTVTQLDGALGYAGAGGDPVAASAAGLNGLVKTVALEAAEVYCRALDFAPGMDPSAIGKAFLREIADVATDLREVALDGSQRRAPALSDTPEPLLPAPPDTAELTDDDVLLVTGGGAGITAWCLTALAEEHRCGYVLLGRTPLADEPEWAHGLQTPEALREALAERAGSAGQDSAAATPEDIGRQAAAITRLRTLRATLDELRSRGVRADYVCADVSDARSVAQALAPHAARITGVIHAAGVLGDRPLTGLTAESAGPVIGTKLSGLYNVLAALDADRLRHLVVFSSVTGLWGNLRQADYALANEALNRAACAVKAAFPARRVLPLVWGPWEGGMAADLHHLFTEAKVPVLSREAGVAHFRARMGAGHGNDGVTLIGPGAPWLDRVDQLPEAGITALRDLDGLEREPMLRDHRLGGHPLVPMTAVLGACLHTVERARGGQAVVQCRDVRVTRGLYLNGDHPKRISLRLDPDPHAPAARVSGRRADGREEKPLFEGVFQWGEHDEQPPPLDLPPYQPSDELHPCYAERLIFHGPSLAGLRRPLEEGDGRLVLPARLPDPVLAHGAYAGRLYSPGLADLLLQAAALVSHRHHGSPCLPLSVERVDLFAPLPHDTTFLIVGERAEATVFDIHCTITACDLGGKVLQKWTRLKMINVSESQLLHALNTYFPARPRSGSQATG